MCIRDSGSNTARFARTLSTLTASTVPVSFTGMLPDLFKEGKGVVAQGQLQDEFFDKQLQVQARVFAGQEKYGGVLHYGTPVSFPATGDWPGTGDAGSNTTSPGC